MTNSSGRPIELTKEDVLQTFSELQSFILTEPVIESIS
jgi:BioD-like phosphotransacetylase family protein